MLSPIRRTYHTASSIQRVWPEARSPATRAGSHYLTHADFGCRDGDHRGWIIVDVENKGEARNTLPPAYRAQARIVGLNKFSLEEIDELLKPHGG